MQQNSLPVDTPEFIRAKQVAKNASNVSFVDGSKNFSCITLQLKFSTYLVIYIMY